MNLVSHYQEAIDKGEIEDDKMQREVLSSLQRLCDDLNAPLWRRWRKKTPQGLYLYGSVGVGKTFLIDFFYHHVEERKKARFHFHHFMQQIDLQLRKAQGQKDPLRLIAKQLAKTTRLLCFDEFLVNDVAYAMILAELLNALMAEGVILVFSSNTAPDNLYLNGVQRARFLPAIALIKKNCEVLCLVEKRDYRYGHVAIAQAYLYPLNEETQQTMLQEFKQLAPSSTSNGFLSIQNREIPYLQCALKTIWFDFAVLCTMPRSQLDYLEIASRFDEIFLSNIPKFTEKHLAQVILFVYLIDVLYDQGIKLIVSAEVPADELYEEGEMKETFKRTLSRLKEMQSEEYLSKRTRRVVLAM